VARSVSTLSTVSLHYVNNSVADMGPGLAKAAEAANIDPNMPIPDSPLTFIEAAGFQATFTEGATNAFLIGSVMMLAASVVIWLFLDVKHAELATDGPEAAPVHVG